MNQSANFQNLKPEQKEKLLGMYQSLFEGKGKSLILEKKKTPTSGLIERQVTLSKIGFLQTKNQKVIPYNNEFVFESKEQFDVQLLKTKSQFPWSKSGGVARVYFCRLSNNMTNSLVANFQKPTCVYFNDQETAKDFATFKVLFGIPQLQLDRIQLYTKFFHSKLTIFVNNAIKHEAEQQRQIRDKRRQQLCLKLMPKNFNKDKLVSLVFNIMIVVNQRDLEERQRHKEEIQARRKYFIQNNSLLQDINRKAFSKFNTEWLSRSQDALWLEEELRKIEQEEAELLAQQEEEEEYEDDQDVQRVLVTPGMTPQPPSTTPQPPVTVVPHVPIVPIVPQVPAKVVDTEAIHVPIELTKFTLYIDKIFKMVSPKLQIQFVKYEGSQRKSQVTPKVPSKQVQDEYNKSDPSIFFDTTLELLPQHPTQQCLNCNELAIDDHYVVQGYSFKDRVEFYVYDDEIDLRTQGKSSRRILFGQLKIFELFKNTSNVKRFYLPLEITQEFQKQHMSDLSWKDHPMLAIDLRTNDSTFKDFTEFLTQASQIGCSGESNIIDNNYYEVLRYPLQQQDYILYKMKGLNKTKLWNERRLSDLETGLHNRGHSLSNGLWSRQEVTDLIELLDDDGQIPMTSPLNHSDSFNSDFHQSRRKFHRLEQYIKNQQVMKDEVTEKILLICKRGVEHHDRPHLLTLLTHKTSVRIQNIFNMGGSFNQDSHADKYGQMVRASQDNVDMMTLQSIQQDADEYLQELNRQYDWPCPTNDYIIAKNHDIHDSVVGLLKTQAFINQQMGLLPYSSHLVKIAFRVVQLFSQEIHKPRLEQCQQLITFLWQCVGQQQTNFVFAGITNNFSFLPQRSLDMIFQILLFSLPPPMRNQLLALNIEYCMVDYIVSCFSSFFHYEAWARVLDFLVGCCLCDTETEPILYLVGMAVQIIFDNFMTLSTSRTGTEFLANLKIYGHVTINIDLFLKNADETIDHLKQNLYNLPPFELIPPQQLYDNIVTGQLKEKNEQLQVLKEFSKDRNLSLASIQQFIFLQAQFDPYRKLPEFQSEPEEAGISVPEEHENSVMRDMEMLDRQFTDIYPPQAGVILQPQQNVPELIKKPKLGMIYLMIHDLKINSNDIGDQELIVTYGPSVQVFALPRSDWPEYTTYIQLQSVPSIWELVLQICTPKIKGGQCLKSTTIDVRKYRLDTVIKLNQEFNDPPQDQQQPQRYYIRSTATLSIIITSLVSSAKPAPIEQKFLQQSFYEESPSVIRIQGLDPSFSKSITQLNRQVINFDHVQSNAFQLLQWKSTSVCSYEDFKKIMKLIFNVDSSQVALQQMYRTHSASGSPFYILNFLINMIVILPGSYTLKCSLLFDLVQLFQFTVSSPELGLLPEQVQSLIHALYKIVNVPINLTSPMEDGVILKATVKAQKADLEQVTEDARQQIPQFIDITAQLNTVVNFKYSRFLNKDLLLIDNDKCIFFIQQMLTPEQVNQLNQVKTEQYLLSIKYWSDQRIHKEQYIVDKQFKLVNNWQDRRQSFRSVEHLLGENKRILPLQGQKGQLITKKEFTKMMKQLPGLEFCLSSLSLRLQRDLSIHPKITVYVGFKQYAEIHLKINPAHKIEDYWKDNQRVRILFHECKKHLNILDQQIQRDFADHPLIEVMVEIPNMFLSSDVLLSVIETAILNQIVYAVKPKIELFELEIESMTKHLFIKEQLQYYALPNTGQLSFIDIQLLSHSQDFAINYSFAKAKDLIQQDPSKLDGTSDYPHLGSMQYSNSVQTLKPCRLENYIKGRQGQGVKSIGVVFQQDPKSVILLQQNDLLCLDKYDINELDLLEKPWKNGE